MSRREELLEYVFWLRKKMIELEPGEQIFRIRKRFGDANGLFFCFHADVVARSEEEALTAARKGMITNWRWIETRTASEQSEEIFDCLGSIEPISAKRPVRPV